ncbi:unnamed protein product [Pleuronectes platessa]|uniref:Uncharacterized protein n=1 Tax=Pleuronectes platessa TaxID=8262 RepID=A0A9N7Y9P0_PLEPL|nr:unnamed protein product [Pleuronectes platessa]
MRGGGSGSAPSGLPPPSLPLSPTLWALFLLSSLPCARISPLRAHTCLRFPVSDFAFAFLMIPSDPSGSYWSGQCIGEAPPHSVTYTSQVSEVQTLHLLNRALQEGGERGPPPMVDVRMSWSEISG